MSREYPDWISPARAAEGKRVFSGTIPLSRMKRLAELLADVKGEASFVAAFRFDMEKRIIVDLRVEAALPLVCQASLALYQERVARQIELAVVEDEQAEAELPECYEPVRTEHGRLAIAGMVEDELLLGLPQIPRKPGLEWVAYSTGGKAAGDPGSGDGSRKRPFSELQDILKRGTRD